MGEQLKPEVRAILEQHMGAKVINALDSGKGVVVYPENLNAILSRSGWRDISTCPKGEEPFLVIGGTLKREVGGNESCVSATKVATLDGGCFYVEDTDYYGVYVRSPTHWQPLPEPPNHQ